MSIMPLSLRRQATSSFAIVRNALGLRALCAVIVSLLVCSSGYAQTEEDPPPGADQPVDDDAAQPDEEDTSDDDSAGEEDDVPDFVLPEPNLSPDSIPSGSSSQSVDESEPDESDTAGDEPSSSSSLPSNSPQNDSNNDDDELTLSDWTREDWTLLNPELSLVELNGYFRVRSQFFRRLNFGNGPLGAEDPSRFEVNEEVNDRSDGEEANRDVNLNGTDMRVRFEPTVNVTEQVQVITTLDLLDNLVLGSTPLTRPFFRVDEDGNGDPDRRDTPNNILNRSQQPPVAGVNNARDSILVRRAYARMRALNDQLQFDIGRMPDHWGLGMMINNGDCLDCDFGDVVDRAIVGVKAVGHLFQASFTLLDGGPTIAPFYDRLGPVYDQARWDDVDQFDLRIQKVDHPDTIVERRLRGETVINYGLLNAFRLQKDGLNFEFFDTDTSDPEAPLNTTNDLGDPVFVREERNGFLYIGDAFVRLFSGPWSFEAEGAAMIGSFDDLLLEETLSQTEIRMFGGHGQLSYSFDPAPRKGAMLSLRGGAASGDRGQSGEEGRGFGAFDRIDTQRGGSDDTLSAFQFSPDFHIDQLLFRRVIGTVIDAWYTGPEVRYFFDEAVEGRAAVNYAQTFFSRNVPGEELPLGVEVDTTLIFGAPSKTAKGGEIFATAEGAILFPLSGFDTGIDGGGSFAWSLQAKLFLTF